MSTLKFESMRHWKLSTLLACSGVQVLGQSADIDPEISELVDDSRRARPGACFVAVRGTHSDGHLYLDAACRAGAAAVVSEEPFRAPPGVAVVVVKDSRITLAALAATFYGLFPSSAGIIPPRIIGITGTNGKTTVAWLLRSILAAAGHKSALLGTVEYDLAGERLEAPLTTPGAIDLCRHIHHAMMRGAQYAVLEVSSHALDQHRTDGLRFSAAVFTNLSGDHLDYHKTMDRYCTTKQRLFAELHPDAVAIVNADDPRASKFVDCTVARTVRFAIDNARADVYCRVNSLNMRNADLRVIGPTFEFDIATSLIGRHNVQNILAAVATAEALGIDTGSIQAGVEAVSCIPGRLERATGPDDPCTAVVDYAHTDDALANVLCTLRELTSGRLITVFGCGGDRDRPKRPRMASVAERYSDVAVVTSDNPRTEDPQRIIGEILTGFSDPPGCEVMVASDRRQAITRAVKLAGPDDTVLVAGKGHETYQLVGCEVLPFHDIDVLQSVLRRRSADVATAEGVV